MQNSTQQIAGGPGTGTSKLGVECCGMLNPDEAKRTQLKLQLQEVEARFRSEMLARGFDPAQGDNLALTAPLAKLYMERENLRAEIASLSAT